MGYAPTADGGGNSEQAKYKEKRLTIGPHTPII